MGLPWLFDAMIKYGKGFTVNGGKNIACASHVKDVADVFVMFVEEALKPESTKLAWGEDGYYYIESGGFAFEDMVPAVAKVLAQKGLIKSSEVEVITPDQVNELHPWGSLVWGRNMYIKADRLRNLGWEPKQPSAYECLEEMIAAHC